MSGFPVGKGTFGTFVLDRVSVWVDFTVSHEFGELFGSELGETPVLGSVDLLSAWELHFGSSKGFVSVVVVSFFGSDGQDWISDVDSRDQTVWFTITTRWKNSFSKNYRKIKKSLNLDFVTFFDKSV